MLEFYFSFRYSKIDGKMIEEVTRGQNQNVEWYQQSRGSLTSSEFSRIQRFVQGGTRISGDILLRDVLGEEKRHMGKPRRSNVSSLSWGTDNEPKARDEYRSLEAPHPQNIKASLYFRSIQFVLKVEIICRPQLLMACLSFALATRSRN